MDSTVDVPYLKQASVGNPAAGVDWRYTCPGIGVQRVVALQATFTASAAAANRFPSLTLSDGSNDFATAPINAAVTANLATIISTFPGAGGQGVAAGPQLWAAPHDGWMLLPGWSIRTVTTAIDAADQWSAIRLWVAEYPTGPIDRLTPDVAYFKEPKG